MPWRECSVTQERLRFVARLLEGEGMSEVCRSFGISRKTGYKIFNRYKDQGLDALADRSRRPVRYANQLPDQVERLIVDLKRDKPHWGARKIRELLVRKLAGDVRLPAKSTVHAVLDRHGLVRRARARRNRAQGTPLSSPAVPNALWCADFKGEFKLGDGRYCYPLTVSDQASRYLLLCEALESTREAPVFKAFQQLFRERGLPVRYNPSPMSPGRTPVTWSGRQDSNLRPSAPKADALPGCATPRRMTRYMLRPKPASKPHWALKIGEPPGRPGRCRISGRFRRSPPAPHAPGHSTE